MVHIFVDDSNTIAWSQDIGAAQCLPRRKFSIRFCGLCGTVIYDNIANAKQGRPMLEHPVTTCYFILFYFIFYLLKKQYCFSILLSQLPFSLGCPPPLFFISIMSQQLIMMQQSTGLHSVLNSKGKVSVDGTPKDAVCRFYFSIELNQLQLTAELSDQETKGSMHWHWQWNIERYHPKCGRPTKDVCPAFCFSPYDTIGDKITASTFSCSLQTMLEC